MKNIRIYLCLLLILAAIASACSGNASDGAAVLDEDAEIMEVYVFKSDNSEAILITVGGKAVMIDAGSQKQSDKIKKYLKKNGITNIDYLIATHFDNDHIGGADTLLKKLKVGKVIVPDYKMESVQYEEFKKALKKSDAKKVILTGTLNFTLGGADFTVYPSMLEFKDFRGDEGDDDENWENDFSIAVKVVHGGNSFLFTGDAMDSRIGELLADEDIVGVPYTFLKMPHHGKYHKNIDSLVKVTDPKYAVVTDSSKRPANKKTVSALERNGTKVFCTSITGVLCRSDGNGVTVENK